MMADHSEHGNLAATTTKAPKMPSKPGHEAAETTLSNYDEAVELRSPWEDMWQEAYDFSMPNRSGFYEDETKGSKNTDDILDSTAVHALTDFTSRIRSGVVPDGAQWIDLRPGTDFDGEESDGEITEEIKLGLQEIQDDIFNGLSESNASSEMDEAITEMAVGTGVLHVEDGGVDAPFRFTAVPLSEVYINQGPFGAIDEIYRPLKVRGSNIKIKWPEAKIPETLAAKIKDEPRKMIDLVEATFRDWTSNEHQFKHQIIWKDEKHLLIDNVLIGEGSSPWIVFRWAKGAGEVWGRGPLLSTLPDIRTTNLTVELILENAEKAIAGMWQSDDETINPETISFVPGTIIAKMPGSSGLEPLEAPGRLDFAQMILQDMRDNIRRGLFSDPLGPTGKTPQSATEASFRIADLNRRISSPFGRMVNELVKPLTKRLLYLRRAQGRIHLPLLNGRSIRITPTSPLAKAADQEMILSIDRFLEQVTMRMGEQALQLMVKPQEIAGILAELHGVPLQMINSKQEIMGLIEGVAQQVMGRQLEGGANPQDLLKLAA